MERHIGDTLVRLEQGDITTFAADAIVNAANAALAGGGGVDGAIHRAGGPAIAAACRDLPHVRPGVRCPTGQVRATTAGELQARYVLHAVGPIYDSADPDGSAALLAQAYRSSLEEGARLGCRSLVFPSLSTGAYRFPLRPAATTALTTVKSFLDSHGGVYDRITFALFSQRDQEIFGSVLSEVVGR